MIKIVSFFSLVMAMVLASTAGYSATINCERTTSDSKGYSTFAAFESWWPKNINLDGNDFKEAGAGSKAMVYKNTGGEKRTGNQFTRILRLLPNNLLIGSVKPFGNYQSVTNIRYKCDINSNELRVKLAEGGAAPSAPSTAAKGCFGGNLAVCDTEFICQKATSTRSGSREWETTGTWEKYVKEAKSRGLKCDVNLSTSSPSSATPTSSSSKIDKAKATCTDLGFTAGTEKHGECVLKVMDN
jgi:hypothetical protein